LFAKSALGIGHSGNATIETVKHHGAKNTNRRLDELPLHGHHNGVKAPKQRRQSK